MSRTRTASMSVAVALSALLLTGCAGAQQAIDQAQGVVDDAQSLVDSAASVASAPEALGQACRTALDGLVPGTPLEDARGALDRATAEADAALGVAGGLPIVSELRDTLVAASKSMLEDGSTTTLASARQAVIGLCGPLPSGEPAVG